eukprot:COSAG05_NODE_4493_length_1490_cov_5.082674_2_plen_72_part_01
MRKTKKRVTAATKLQALARGKHVRSQQKRHEDRESITEVNWTELLLFILVTKPTTIELRELLARTSDDVMTS